MVRRLISSLLLALLAGLAAGHAGAAGRSGGSVSSPILQRFLAIDDPTPSNYRALRHLDAQNDRFDSTAWMDVWTEADQTGGFRFQIVGEGGSEYIRSRVFRATLETEKKMWDSGAPDRAAVTLDNYVFEDEGAQSDGLARL